ncbi:6,7-dimethyl-8-ribityllumazine synthase [Neorhodopirellula pilleata]|uniref:6,7-dimethyl-8-ribityllumazine synthase n=1 Tax=Neorhodopirellula pilleata TaxID=2714738 RepID=A0A5C6ABA1_9BACT|nr:6,7-dimethyl-8-ribityllumazine synthase [Neorhodopirellula pilleata]TWT95603.1 6,7-dimethyl-8-ribityllumazine synthase [Neorhodopirellula pilleata]
MTPSIDGTSGEIPTGRIAIIASRYNESICDSMLAAAIETLTAAGIAQDRLWIIRVPGAWELCLAVEQTFQHPDVLAAITLGCVIRGETTHDEHINRAVSDSLMRQSIASTRPVGFGLLTCNTLEQAIQRSGGTVGNKGHEAAEAVLEMLRLGLKLR